MAKPNRTISIEYNKSSIYRAIHADGFVGGPTSFGLMSISVYSEYSGFPKEQKLEINDENVLQKEIYGQTDSIERLVESTLIISPVVTVSLMLWLNDNIKLMREKNILSDDAFKQITAAHEASRAGQ